jgi:hypothetical protein
MNKKILGIAAIVVIFAMSFLYLNQGYLAASNKDGSTCSKTSCDDKNKKSGNTEVKAGGEWNEYAFNTDQACCEEMKADLQKELTSVAGVKEVKFGLTCSSSKMTHVIVYYSAGETNEEAIASFVKGKSYDCSGKSGCDKEGVKSGENNKGGCDSKKECPGKNKKSSDSKQL